MPQLLLQPLFWSNDLESLFIEDWFDDGNNEDVVDSPCFLRHMGVQHW